MYSISDKKYRKYTERVPITKIMFIFAPFDSPVVRWGQKTV